MNRIKVLTFLIGLSLSLFFSTPAQERAFDTTAVLLLDRMGEMIGGFGSCSYKLNSSYDVIDVELGLVKHFISHSVYMVGPDKMLIDSKGEKGHRGYWYNGKQLAYYSYTQNNYAIIDAPPNIIATIDTVNKTYGVDFPAADLFYPTFTDDLIDNNDEIIYVGNSDVNGKDCFHIIAKNDRMGVQVWISNDALFLPMKMVIVYYDVSPNTQYEATFNDWEINPELPTAMFEFSPPPGAREMKLIAKQQ